MSRGRRLIHLLRAVDLMARPQGTTIAELEHELLASRRSVYRLIDIMQELGFPIYEDRDLGSRQKRWRLEESYIKRMPNIALPDIKLGFSEILVLGMVVGESRIIKTMGLEASLHRLMTRIEAGLPDGLLTQLKKIQTLFVPSTKFSKDYSDKDEVIERLTDAMLQQRACQVRYHAYTYDDINSFVIEPLHFFEHNGGLYAYARVPKHDAVITLAVERILDLELSDRAFDYPSNFDPEAKFAAAFGVVDNEPVDVRIWFSSREARYVKERTWAAKQSIVENDDGSIILEMSTSGVWEVGRWVLSWGKEAKVLEPEELRQEVEEEIAAMARLYA